MAERVLPLLIRNQQRTTLLICVASFRNSDGSASTAVHQFTQNLGVLMSPGDIGFHHCVPEQMVTAGGSTRPLLLVTFQSGDGYAEAIANLVETEPTHYKFNPRKRAIYI